MHKVVINLCYGELCSFHYNFHVMCNMVILYGIAAITLSEMFMYINLIYIIK